MRFWICLFLAATGAFACRCTEPPVWTAYKAAHTVVMVKVLSAVPGTGTSTVMQAQVVESWKHPVSGEITITTDTDCAYPAKAGREYLLFLEQNPAGHFSTGFCMGNKEKAFSSNAVAWLRQRH